MERRDVPSVQFQAYAAGWVAENGGSQVAYTIYLNDPFASGTFSVDYATSGLTATEGTDYVGTSGTVTLSANGSSVIYVTINDDADNEDYESFTLVLSNATGGAGIHAISGVATIVDDDLPVATADSYNLTPNTGPHSLTVLGNDGSFGPAGGTITGITDWKGPYGTLNIATDGKSIVYTPGDWVGDATFNYVVEDEYGGSATATVTIHANSPPVAATDVFFAQAISASGTSFSFNVLSNDSDPDGDTLSAHSSLVTDPLNGTVAMGSDGTFWYEPDVGFDGVDYFEYLVDDGYGGTSQAWAYVVVLPPIPKVSISTAVCPTAPGVDGTFSIGSSDINGLSLSMTNDIGASNPNGAFGANTVATEHAFLKTDGTRVAAVFSGVNTRTFQPAGSDYELLGPTQETLRHETGEFSLTEASGRIRTFYDFDTALPAVKRGQPKSIVDPDGTETLFTYDGTGMPTGRTETLGDQVKRWSFEYGTGADASRVVRVLSELWDDSATTWETVESADFAYYQQGDSHGIPGQIKRVDSKDAADAPVDSKYFRYYGIDDADGFAGAVKSVFGGTAYARLAQLGDPESMSDSAVQDYADNYFEYEGNAASPDHRKLKLERASGQGCSVCSGGQGEFAHDYTTNSSTLTGDLFNQWKYRKETGRPDGSTLVEYTNTYGQVILSALTEAGSTPRQWLDYYNFDSTGNLLFHANPSAVTGYDDTYTDLVHFVGGNAEFLNDAAGLLEVYAYGASTTATDSAQGDALGKVKSTALRHGETGGNVLQSSVLYTSRTTADAVTFHVTSATVYRDDAGTETITTTVAYTFASGSQRITSVATTLPVVGTSHNGSNSASTSEVVFDADERPIWTRDAAGVLNFTQYDSVTGAVVKSIQDVDTSRTGDFTDLPSGWSTPTGAGFHLVSTFEVDVKGRTTKSVDPMGRTTYTVYNDADHEVRIYAGWTGTTTTGPVTVYRDDRAGGYSETITMAVTPDAPYGVPTGTEAISNIQSLSRNYRNEAGQVTHSDQYFDLAGVTYSTDADIGAEGVNYYRTRYTYGKQGEQNKTVSPAGTITRSEIDAMGRTVSVWVGTDDTPTSGYWSTSNLAGTNMVKVGGYEYDNGGVGDGNLTKRTLYSNAASPDQLTESAYDWRNRLVAMKEGVETIETGSVNRPLTVYDYDNLNQVVRTRTYDGDAMAVTVPSGIGTYAFRFGNTSGDTILSLTANLQDSAGNIYVSGNFTSTVDFDPGVGSAVLNASSGSGFIASYAGDGTFRWVVQSPVTIPGIAFDGSGSVYATGQFYGTQSFGGASFTYSATGLDAFVWRLGADDGHTEWVALATGSGSANGLSVTADGAGSVYVSGTFTFGSSTFGSGTSSVSMTPTGTDVFVWKLAASTGQTTWTASAGGAFGVMNSTKVAVDGSGNVYAIGTITGGTTISFGVTSLTRLGSDVFVWKLDSSGSTGWVSQAGGSSLSVVGYGITVDSSGDVYATGNASSGVVFGGTISNVLGNTYVWKMDSSNGASVWVVGAGDLAVGYGALGYDIAVDKAGDVYVSGNISSTNAVTFGWLTLEPSYYGGMIWKLRPQDGETVSVIRTNNSGSMAAQPRVAIDGEGAVYAAGVFYGTVGFGTTTLTAASTSWDGFVWRAATSLRAETRYSYDERGNLYKTETDRIDQVTGTAATSPDVSQSWYDTRGLLAKTETPNGLVQKYAYDSLGRLTVSSTTNGGGDTGYAHALTVTGDTVFTQSEYAYDAAGQVVLTVDRQRIDGVTDTGALDDSIARTTATLTYYDLLGRVTSTVDAGTSGRFPWYRYGSSPFVGSDTDTQGGWSSNYGSEGYVLSQGASSIPSFASVTLSGESNHTWSTTSSDPRALEQPGTSDRLAAAWYTSTTFDIDVSFTDGLEHRVALYMLDWDGFSGPRLLRVDVIDQATNTLLDTRIVADYGDGVIMSWVVGDAVTFRITNTSPYSNALVSAIYIDPASVVSYVGADTETEGSWSSAFGTEGYILSQGASSVPSYANVSVSGESDVLWTATSSDPRAMEQQGTSDRLAAAWYSFTSFDIGVSFTDGQDHMVSMYLLDWDGWSGPRHQRIDVIDPASNALLDSRTFYNFGGGVTPTWVVRGDVTFRVTNLSPYSNAMVSAVYIDPVLITTYTYGDNGLLAGVTDANGVVSATTYDLLGRTLTHTEAAGTAVAWTTSYAYNAYGQLESVSAPGSRTTGYGYDLYGRMVSVTEFAGTAAERTTETTLDMLGRTLATNMAAGTSVETTTAYFYDALGRVVSVTQGVGSTVERTSSTTYDVFGRTLTGTDFNGNVTHHAYDDPGRAVTTTDALGKLWTSVYDNAGNLVAATDPLSHTTTYGYDLQGRMVSTTTPLLNTTKYRYLVDGYRDEVEDALNHVTAVEYDRFGNVGKEIDALGHGVVYGYDRVGRVVSMVDARGTETDYGYDELGRLVTQTDAAGEAEERTSTWTYTVAGDLQSAFDGLGRETRYGYDDAGRVTSTTAAYGTAVAFTTTTAYDLLGRTVSTTAPGSRTTGYEYDELGQLVEMTEAVGTALERTTGYSYDANGNLVSTTDPMGVLTEYVYDALDRRTSTTEAVGTVVERTTSVAYDDGGRMVSTTDARNNTTQYAYDADGRMILVTNALSEETEYEYDAVGNLIAVTDALDHTTTYGYDAANRMVSVTTPLLFTTTYGYDANGNRTTVTDARSNTTSYGFDKLNRNTTVTNALSQTTTSEYDAGDQLIQVTNARGAETEYEYDALGRLTLTTDPLNHTTENVYDAAGDLVEVVDALNESTFFTYDELGRRSTMTLPRGGVTTTLYDANDRTVAVVDPVSGVRSWGYDELGRVTGQTDANSHNTQFQYDANDNRIVLTDASSNTTQFQYDQLNRLVIETDPLSKVSTTTYDAAGNLASHTDRLGRTIVYGYDDDDRRTSEEWLDALSATVQTQTYGYDEVGNLLTATDPDGSYAMTYDALNRVATTVQPFGFEQAFTYDEAGNRTLVTDNKGGTTTSVFDLADRLTSRVLNDGTNETQVDFTYNARNELTRTDRSFNSVSAGYTSYTYNADGQKTGILAKDASNSTVADFTYVYDLAGRLTSKTENGVTSTYANDAEGQVTDDNGTSFAYDSTGNRTGGTSIGANNRLLSDGTWTYAYDDAGFTVSKTDGTTTWDYAYDNRGQLTSATNGTVTVTYAYDAFGNRLTRSDGTTTEKFAYDGWNPAHPSPVGNENFDAVADLDASDDVTMRRMYGEGFDDLLARVDASGVVGFYATDIVGSVRRVLDDTGSVVASGDFDAFGNLVAGTLTDRYGYTAREWDANLGLQFNRARMYDPTTGRWYAEDEKGFDAGDVNLYRYVGNQTNIQRDPSGLDYVTEEIVQGFMTVQEGYLGWDDKLTGHKRCNLGPQFIGVPNKRAESDLRNVTIQNQGLLFVVNLQNKKIMQKKDNDDVIRFPYKGELPAVTIPKFLVEGSFRPVVSVQNVSAFAFTAIDVVRAPDGSGTVTKKPDKDGNFIATYTLDKIRFAATFNKNKSEILFGLVLDNNDPVRNKRLIRQLILHEQLHLAISQYVASKFTGAGLLPLTVSAKNKDAETAKRAAYNKMQVEVNSLQQIVESMIFDVNEKYDEDTKHGKDPFRQAAWAAKYKEFVDRFIDSTEDRSLFK